MLLKISISNTKMLFRKTLNSFKSFFNGGYQKLPKNPPFETNITQNYKELDKFYTDFTQQWDTTNREQRKQGKKQRRNKQVNERRVYSGSLLKRENIESFGGRKEDEEETKKKNPVVIGEGDRERTGEVMMKTEEILRPCLVAEKLKELEMIDNGNLEHVLDIEEVLHCYSKLTCPAYVDIVDKFFMEMYAEISPS